ncbi:hypothetical protein H4582DRAFT_2087413 [Lactarius indigo]|nr:hypothetical protein H4582DRAFT_2087413 [Lactarius indigo]
MASDDNDSSSSQRGPFNSDLEDEVNSVLLPSTVSTLPPNLLNQQLHEMLKASQIHQQMLGNELKALRIDYEELEEVNNLKSTKTSRAARGSLEGESREISLARGRFSIVGELWVKKTTLGIPFPEHLDPLDPSHYNDPAGGSEARGVITELYRDLKPHLWLALVDPDQSMMFKNIFLKQLDQECANSAHAVRPYVPCFFDGLNLSSALFARNFDRMTSPELQKLLGSPAKPSMTYAPFPRLIFPNYDVSSHRPYWSMFLKLIFYGPSSIDGEATAKRLTKGVIWGVNLATPGMIAMAATLSYTVNVCGLISWDMHIDWSSPWTLPPDQDRQRPQPDTDLDMLSSVLTYSSTCPPSLTPGTTPAPSHLPTPHNSSLPPIPLPTANAEGSTTGRMHKSVNYAKPKLNTKMHKSDL